MSTDGREVLARARAGLLGTQSPLYNKDRRQTREAAHDEQHQDAEERRDSEQQEDR